MRLHFVLSFLASRAACNRFECTDDSSFALGMKFIAEEAAERARARMLRLFGTSDASAFFCSELYSQPPAGFSVQGGQRLWL